MRKVSIAPDSQGVMRIQLNNKFIFQYGLLDQGFWPDGLYTAPSDDALKADIEVAKKLGFNLLRKHVKVEPQRWYYWCDRLGMLVWQDMPSGDRAAHWSQLPEITRSEKSKACYERELKAMVDGLRNHPSIITWVPFNEGWGQYDTIRIINWTMQYDTSRLVDAPSGWNDFPSAGHMVDRHEYPGPAAPSFEKSRALVLGEFGGLGYSVVGHTWNGQGWSSNQLHTTQELNAAYVGLMAELKRLVESSGLSAAIYTQLADVEAEINGITTYDRAVMKFDEETMIAAHKSLFEAAHRIFVKK
jgi:beta-galactosidase/beta-glucuronidase